MLHTEQLAVPYLFAIYLMIKYTYILCKDIERVNKEDYEVLQQLEIFDRNTKWPNWKKKSKYTWILKQGG